MRLIDADELKEAMREHTDYKGYLVCDPEEVIDLAPTVERPQWIPCSERLPETAGFYLITFKSGLGYTVCEMYYRKIEDFWSENGVKPICLSNEEVLAWMPLPNPYQKEGEAE